MQISTLITFAVMTGVAVADLHNAAVCVVNRRSGTTGNGTPYGLGYGSFKEYEISPAGTQCACNYYKNRNHGNPKATKQWEKCTDCKYDGIQCTSPGWHIGGDEMEYYCRVKCGTQGSEAN